MNGLEFSNVTKYYKNTKALDKINMVLEPNKIYGLLGRNGAGKTTLLNLLTNKIFPTEGDIKIGGESVFENDRVLSQIFYMTEKNLYPEDLKIKEIFKWTERFYPDFDLAYAEGLATSFDLNINKKIKSLSTGYTSIFKAILALASNASILIFDEPILGLDANHREMFYKALIENYNKAEKTIIISTHLIEEIDHILEDVIIIKHGQIIEKQSVEALLESSYRVSGEAKNIDLYTKDKKGIEENTLGRFKSVIVLESEKNHELAKSLNLEFSKVKLQKLFINLTNS
jgi:ABC-2 type transport system ATP-binding protein